MVLNVRCWSQHRWAQEVWCWRLRPDLLTSRDKSGPPRLWVWSMLSHPGIKSCKTQNLDAVSKTFKRKKKTFPTQKTMFPRLNLYKFHWERGPQLFIYPSKTSAELKLKWFMSVNHRRLQQTLPLHIVSDRDTLGRTDQALQPNSSIFGWID